MSWLTSNWQLLASALGGLGGGAGLRPLLDYWARQRVQTDGVVERQVERLEKRIETLEADAALERAACDRRLRELTNRLNNSLNEADGMMLALKYAPGSATDIVADIEERRRWKLEQTMAAAARVDAGA